MIKKVVIIHVILTEERMLIISRERFVSGSCIHIAKMNGYLAVHIRGEVRCGMKVEFIERDSWIMI